MAIPFETEFPVAMDSPYGFVAQVIAWLRGNNNSRVLEATRDADLDTDHATIRTDDGESLALRVLRSEGVAEAVGFRYDIPEAKHGRFWRTEAVLRWVGQGSGEGLLRLRGTCLPLQAGAVLERPKKPFLIKTLLAEARGGIDGLIAVKDAPHRLPGTEEGLLLARFALEGGASNLLPVVYVSQAENVAQRIPLHELNRLARHLGGVAHVLTEPDRNFSFSLRDLMDGRNPSGGVVAIAVPGKGILRRVWLGPLVPDVAALLHMTAEAAIALRSAMPATGWDWTALQDASLRQQRDRERGLLAENAERQGYEALYEEQITNLKDRIAELEGDLQMARASASAQQDRAAADLPMGLIQEIYAGELVDRLRMAAERTLSDAERDGLDRRSIAVLQAFLAAYPQAQARADLIADVGRATRDPARLAAQVERLLLRHGYVGKSNNKHVRLEAAPGFAGLASLTIPKTPGEYRGLKNQCGDILNALGLSSRGQ